jgi:hypothetical protein
MDIKRLSEKYIKARDYEGLINTEGYKRLKLEKLEFAKKIGQQLIRNGLKDNQELDELKMKAKAYQDLFIEIEGMANQRERLEETLKELGVGTSAR